MPNSSVPTKPALGVYTKQPLLSMVTVPLAGLVAIIVSGSPAGRFCIPKQADTGVSTKVDAVTFWAVGGVLVFITVTIPVAVTHCPAASHTCITNWSLPTKLLFGV